EFHLLLERVENGEDRLPVGVVEQADQPEHGHDRPAVPAGVHTVYSSASGGVYPRRGTVAGGDKPRRSPGKLALARAAELRLRGGAELLAGAFERFQQLLDRSPGRSFRRGDDRVA